MAENNEACDSDSQLSQTFSPIYPQPVPIATPTSQLGYFQKRKRNRPQPNSVDAASVIFMAGGINNAWSFGFTNYSFFVVTKHVAMAWFIGAIIGAVIGMILNNIIKSRKFIYFISSILLLIDGILSLTLSKNRDAITAAHYIDGIAVGLVFVPTMVLIGEESVSYMRGQFAGALEMYCFYFGIWLQILISQLWTNSMSMKINVIQLQGCINIAFALIAAIITQFCYIESPIYHLTMGNEQEALDCIRRLQNPKVITTETYDILNSDKEYVTANGIISVRQGAGQGRIPLILLTIFRISVAFSLSIATTSAMILSSTAANHDCKWNNMLFYYGCAILLGGTMGTLLVDSLGRKYPALFCLIICTIIAFIVGANFNYEVNWMATNKATVIMSLIIVYQFFAGSYSISSSVCLTEAFSMSVKCYYIAIPFVCQMIVQIIIIATEVNLSDYYYTLGGINIFLGLLILLLMPETKQTTLLGAQRMFATPLRRSNL